jgi:hypothetical protein
MHSSFSVGAKQVLFGLVQREQPTDISMARRIASSGFDTSGKTLAEWHHRKFVTPARGNLPRVFYVAAVAMIKGSLLFRTAAGLTIAVGILREVFCPTTGKVSLRTPSMHCASLLQHRHCERSEAIQNPSAEALWIASSQELLAMTARVAMGFGSPDEAKRNPGFVQ